MFNIPIMAITIFSTYSDKDHNKDVKTPVIIGSWIPLKRVAVDAEGNEKVDLFDTCTKKGSLRFFKNGQLTLKSFECINGNCEEEYNLNGTYVLDEEHLTLTIQGETNIATIYRLTENTLRIGQHDSEAATTIDRKKSNAYTYSEYQRIG
jgi:hypothetical protein